MRIHGFLRDQHYLAGLGRMLANEICHRAKLSPFAKTAKLTTEEIERLHAAIGACIDDALAHERTLDVMSKSADRPGAVHRRKGAECPVCGDVDSGRRVLGVRGRLLPDLSDRRQDPGRQHDVQVPEVTTACQLTGSVNSPDLSCGSVAPATGSQGSSPGVRAQIRSSWRTAVRSSSNSATEASMRAREKSSMSRPWTIE